MKNIILLIVLIFIINGCASFGRGVTEALLNQKSDDMGECRIYTGGFDGIIDIMERNGGKANILMIHGIGKQIPGYSLRTIDSIAFKIGLDVIEKQIKSIDLMDPENPDRYLGKLTSYKYSDKQNTKEITTYEYTWASITEPDKNTLSFDYNDYNAKNRTEISSIIKSFINETGTDAIIYIGNKEKKLEILDGVSQSICWMASDDWDNMPSKGKHTCSANMIKNKTPKNDFIVITHSLGSQISIDAFENIISNKHSSKLYIDGSKYNSKNTNIIIYMFANQLPALAIGMEKPEVIGQIKEYCEKNSRFYNKKFVKRTDIIAFSDPNDVLSYAIPPYFEDSKIDSRLCPVISNVTVNVAPLTNIFGGKAANPFSAHSNYKNDERILNIIINGIHENTRQQEPDKGCYIIREKN